MLKIFLKILFISFLFNNVSYSAEIGNVKQIKFEQTLQDKINKFQMKKWFYITMLREMFKLLMRNQAVGLMNI